jgi:hypothetical protein
MERLESILSQDPIMSVVLNRLDMLTVPDCQVAAGAIAQTVWNNILGKPQGWGLKDIDIIYFDRDDVSAKIEKSREQEVRAVFNDLPLNFDVKNEARVHLWYEDKFGYPIRQYSSLRGAVDTFPTTATCVAARRCDDRFESYATFGYDDLFDLIVRARSPKRFI